MKKTILLGVALAGVLTLAACGDTVATDSSSTDASETTQHIHAFGQWSEEKAATCTQEGQKKRSCACGEVEVETIAPLGHEHEDNGLCSRCGALNEVAWKTAMSGEKLNNYTVNGTMKVTQTRGESVTIINEKIVYKVVEDKAYFGVHYEYVQSEQDDVDMEDTYTGDNYAQGRANMEMQIFTFADCYGEFEYNAEEKAYVLKAPCDVTVDTTTLHYSAAKVTFNEEGKLVKMTYAYTMSRTFNYGGTIEVAAEGEYAFSDYGTTVVADPASTISQSVWEAAFAMSAFENVTFSASAEVQRQSPSHSSQSTQTNTVHIAGESLHCKLTMVSSGQSPQADEYTLTGSEATAEKEEMLADLLVFAEEYEKFAYDDEQKLYVLQQPIEQINGEGEEAVTVRISYCKIGFDQDGRVVSMEFDNVMTYSSNDETVVLSMQFTTTFSDYGTTVVAAE